MPLVWAHSEYLKLARSLADGAVFDTPPQPMQGYIKDKADSPLMIWRFNCQIRKLRHGRNLRIETSASGRVRWSSDGWHTSTDARTRDTGLAMHVVDPPTGKMHRGGLLEFTFYWQQNDHREGRNFKIEVSSQDYRSFSASSGPRSPLFPPPRSP